MLENVTSSMFTDHIIPNYTFDINYTVDILNHVEWSMNSLPRICSIKIPNTQNVQKPKWNRNYLLRGSVRSLAMCKERQLEASKKDL